MNAAEAVNLVGQTTTFAGLDNSALQHSDQKIL